MKTFDKLLEDVASYSYPKPDDSGGFMDNIIELSRMGEDANIMLRSMEEINVSIEELEILADFYNQLSPENKMKFEELCSKSLVHFEDCLDFAYEAWNDDSDFEDEEDRSPGIVENKEEEIE